MLFSRHTFTNFVPYNEYGPTVEQTTFVFFTNFDSQFIKKNYPNLKLGDTIFVITHKNQILKRNKATSYFLGGIYDYQEQSLFKKIFECGKDGLINPKKELELATIKLVEEIKI